jgi:hypothetical protein
VAGLRRDGVETGRCLVLSADQETLHLSVGIDRAVQCQAAVGEHGLPSDPRHLENRDDRLGDVVGLAETRWNTVRCVASAAISGTYWMALAPVPIDATRSPAVDFEWSQFDE